MTPTRPILGLIGAIGAGKSTAAACLAELGGEVVDCDALGHEAIELPAVKSKLVARWGEGILKDGGGINRRTVGRIVFGDPAERAALEAEMFPAIADLVKARLASLDASVRFAVLDAAVLLEAGWKAMCDRIVYIDAPKDVRLARLAARSGWTADELDRREAAQWSSERKMQSSDAVISNTGTRDALKQTLADLLMEWAWLDGPEERR